MADLAGADVVYDFDPLECSDCSEGNEGWSAADDEDEEEDEEGFLPVEWNDCVEDEGTSTAGTSAVLLPSWSALAAERAARSEGRKSNSGSYLPTLETPRQAGAYARSGQ